MRQRLNHFLEVEIQALEHRGDNYAQAEVSGIYVCVCVTVCFKTTQIRVWNTHHLWPGHRLYSPQPIRSTVAAEPVATVAGSPGLGSRHVRTSGRQPWAEVMSRVKRTTTLYKFHET